MKCKTLRTLLFAGGIFAVVGGIVLALQQNNSARGDDEFLCPTCSAPHDPGAKFCGTCGDQLTY